MKWWLILLIVIGSLIIWLVLSTVFYRKFFKRFYDIILSGLAIVILFIPLCLVSFGVMLSVGKPVIFNSKRVTKGEKVFGLLKFRSMKNLFDDDSVPLPDSQRITKLGNIIRKTSLDELPSLFNILKGDMSIVGPRPERWEHVEQYTKEIQEFPLRLKVKGGLTGYAQVYGKYNTSPYEKLEFDLLYINNMNILIDVQLCFATLMTIFKKESTEGVEGITAEKEYNA